MHRMSRLLSHGLVSGDNGDNRRILGMGQRLPIDAEVVIMNGLSDAITAGVSSMRTGCSPEGAEREPRVGNLPPARLPPHPRLPGRSSAKVIRKAWRAFTAKPR